MAAPLRRIRLAHLAGLPAPPHIPLYQSLAAHPAIDLTVYFGSSEGVRQPADEAGYGKPVVWDLDLTEGYRSVFLRAADRTPGLGRHTWSARNWDIAPIVARERYDVLSMGGYNSLTYLMAAVAQRATGGAVLIRDEQTTLDRRSFANLAVKQLTLRPLLAQARGLYVSTANRRWLERFGMPAERLFASPYTVDNDRLQSAAAALAPRRAELRKELGVPSGNAPVVATVCRLIEKKGLFTLLEAFRRARAEVPGVLLIVGSGPLEQRLRAIVERDRIPDVVFGGFLNRSEVTQAYAVADAFALLSEYQETFGLAVNEAMNFSLPIVVSDRVGCAADLVNEDRNGYAVGAGDVDGATRALSRLLRDRDLRERMGSASREIIGSWNVAASVEGFVAASTAAVEEGG